MKAFGITWQGRERQVLALICLAAATLLAGRLGETPIGAITDDAYYVAMARAIAQGQGPVLLTGPDQPAVNPGIFPPGFPYLLSPFARWFANSLGALRVVPLVSAILLFPLALAVPGRTATNRLRLAVGAAVILNPWVIAWAGRILSDLPYTTLSLAALLLFLRWQQQDRPYRGLFVALVLLLTAGICVRTIGWAVWLAMAAILVSERRWRPAVALLLPVVVLVALVQWPAQGGSLLTPGYTSQMFAHEGVPAWRFGLENLLGYVARLPVMVVPVFGQPVLGVMRQMAAEVLYPALAFTTGAALLLAAGLAVVRRWRRHPDWARIRLFTFYLVFYAGALAQFDGYPSGVQTRLLLPVLPILVWLVLAGITEAAGPHRRWPFSWAVGIMLLAALGHNGWRLARPLATTVSADGRGLVDPGRGAAWVLAETRADDVIMVQDTLQRHIHWRRQVVAFPETIGTPGLDQSCRQYGVTRIFVGPTVHGLPRRLDDTGQEMLAALRARPDRYREIHSDPVESIFVFACPPAVVPEEPTTQP